VFQFKKERRTAMNKAYLILDNGTTFEGEFFGTSGVVAGELVFTTGMT
jgi:carbamoyl-phosphate synthase small subunit